MCAQCIEMTLCRSLPTQFSDEDVMRMPAGDGTEARPLNECFKESEPKKPHTLWWCINKDDALNAIYQSMERMIVMDGASIGIFMIDYAIAAFVWNSIRIIDIIGMRVHWREMNLVQTTTASTTQRESRLIWCMPMPMPTTSSSSAMDCGCCHFISQWHKKAPTNPHWML